MIEQGSEVFVARDDELAAVRACADDVEQGRAWVVVVSGTAGSGKTTLVRQAVASLDGFRVVRATAEPFAGDEWMWTVGQLTDGPSGESAFRVGQSLRSFLEQWQSTSPVAVVVEDLHWADSGSRRALLTALSRLEHLRVLALVTTRPDRCGDDAWDRLLDDGERCRLVEFKPLSSQEVSAMADALEVPLGLDAAVRLQRHTGGHPASVRALLTELTPVQLNTGAALPAPRALASATAARFSQLDPESMELVRALAVLGRPSPLTVLGGVAGVADASAALGGALESGFVEREPQSHRPIVRFTQSAQAAIVYEEIPPVRRRELHLAAAAVDAAGSLPHRIAAADRADPLLAGELDRAALATADAALAAEYLTAAADLSASPAQATSRLLAAGRRCLDAGDVRGLLRLQSRLEACPSGFERDLLMGWLAWQTADPDRAEGLLRRAIDRASDAKQASRAYLRLAEMLGLENRSREAIEAGRTVLGLPELDRRHERRARLVIAGASRQLAGADAARAALDRDVGHGHDPDHIDAEVTLAYGIIERYAGRATSALARLDRLAPDLQRGDMAWRLPQIQLIQAQCHYQKGMWDDAIAHATTAIGLAHDRSQSWILAQVNAVAAWVHAGRGQWDHAERRLRHARAAAQDRSNPEATWLVSIADAFLARARHRPADVVAALSPLTARPDTAVRAIPTLIFWPALIHALIDIGAVDSAQRELTNLRAAASPPGLDRHMALLTVEGRLLATGGSAAAARTTFEAAIEAIDADSDVVEQIVLHHSFGRHLRTNGRRREAIAQIARANAIAVRVGAAPYAARTEADLRGSQPGAVRRAADDPLRTLTASERNVVTLVARGATNHEAAKSLYVSVKAVEFHLGNVYAKLHVNRRQLQNLVKSA